MDSITSLESYQRLSDGRTLFRGDRIGRYGVASIAPGHGERGFSDMELPSLRVFHGTPVVAFSGRYWTAWRSRRPE